ncbi:hypothetical protein ES702_01245 [subsurface metagenome]
MIIEIIIALTFVYLVIKVFENKRAKSYEYRKLLTNLYVAGKIKEIAKKDGIDLVKEHQEFNKLSHQRYKNIDDSIERSITNKIKKGTEKVEKNLIKENKKI